MKELKSKRELGKRIHESFQTHSYVDDEIVIELLKQIVTEHEKKGTNYIIEGFPKTQRQALALLKMGIIPDKFILLDRRDGEVIEYLQHKIKNEDVCKSSLRGAGKQRRIIEMGENALAEYKLNIEGVKEIYKGSISSTDANKSIEDVTEEIMHRVLKLKHSKGPSRPQRIILMGTPGCGKEKYAQRIADEHQLVYIQVN